MTRIFEFGAINPAHGHMRELVSGRGADVFSAGAMLWEMLTGERPEAASTGATLRTRPSGVHRDLDTRHDKLVLSLLARQAPVAGDLRLVAALLHVIKHIERMGDQCVNVCKLIPLTGHEPPTEANVHELVLRMGALARSEVLQAKAAFAGRDVELAEDLVRRDREINAIQRDIFRRAIEIGDHPDVRKWAMTIILIARCIERIGDNAVDIGEQTAFVVTGLFREFSDSSHRG